MNALYRVNANLWYIPLKRIIIATKNDIEKDAVEEMLKKNIINDYIDSIEPPKIEQSKYYDFKNIFSNSIDVILTNTCNLKCKYCFYSSGCGDNTTLSKNKIDVIIKYLIRSNKINKLINKNVSNICYVTLTGGGEPTANWDTFVYFVDEFRLNCKNNDLKPYITLVTNGVLTEEKIIYIANYIDLCNVSFDGLPEIQDENRPMVNKQKSSEYVLNTLRMFEKIGNQYSIRSTISYEADVFKIVEYLKTNFKSSVQYTLSNITPLGRGILFNQKQNFIEKFIHEYLDAFNDLLNNENKYLINPKFLYLFRDYYCGMSYGNNIYVHANGEIYPCSAKLNKNDYILGEVCDTGFIEHPSTKKYLTDKEEIENECKQCFAYYHCGGGCPVSHEINNEDCTAIKCFWKAVLSSLANEKDTFGLTAKKIESDLKEINFYQIETKKGEWL